MKKISFLILLFTLQVILYSQELRPDSRTGLLKGSDDFRDVTVYRSQNDSAIEKIPFQVGIVSFGSAFNQAKRKDMTFLLFGFSMPNTEGGVEQEFFEVLDGKEVKKKQIVYRGSLREAIIIADGTRQTFLLGDPSYFEQKDSSFLQAWLDFNGKDAKKKAEYLVFLGKAKEVKIRLRSSYETNDYELTPGQLIALKQVGEAYLNHFSNKSKK